MDFRARRSVTWWQSLSNERQLAILQWALASISHMLFIASARSLISFVRSSYSVFKLLDSDGTKPPSLDVYSQVAVLLRPMCQPHAPPKSRRSIRQQNGRASFSGALGGDLT
jgi:hypothetical protein